MFIPMQPYSVPGNCSKVLGARTPDFRVGGLAFKQDFNSPGVGPASRFRKRPPSLAGHLFSQHGLFLLHPDRRKAPAHLC